MFQGRFNQVVGLLGKQLFQIFVVCVIFEEVSCIQDDGVYINGTDEPVPFPIFYNLKSILEVFHKEMDKQPRVIQRLLQIYQTECYAQYERYKDGKRKPFIVIEGNDRMCREKVGKELAKVFGGQLLLMPPPCVARLSHHFKRGSILRTAFFALANYIAACNVRKLQSQGFAVILKGYWTDQAAFTISKRFRRTKDIPAHGDDMFKFPEDLMVPDLAYYLNNPFDVYNNPLTTFTPYFRPKRLIIYERFRNPPVIEIDIQSTGGVEQAVNFIIKDIYMILGNTCDLASASQVLTHK